jgi:hypothetical protein
MEIKMEDEKFDLIGHQVEALTDLEIAVESGIEECLSEGCDFNDIKKAIITMVQKYAEEIAKQKFRERIQKHNEKLKSNKV